MKPSCLVQDRAHKKDNRCHNYGGGNGGGSAAAAAALPALPPFLFFAFLLATVFTVSILFSPSPLMIKRDLQQNSSVSIVSPQQDCDLYRGHWVPDFRGSSSYTNSSCGTIPDSKNCFRHGRKDMDFLNWRWKPDGCELPRFDPRAFLRMVRGKTLAFIGDSVARNHMESLLCLLSQAETPVDVFKDSEDRFRTWYFRGHDFTLKILWSQFLVTGKEEVINGSLTGTFSLNLDEVDGEWAREVPTADMAVVSAAHWFFRKIYLYERKRLVGCVYCNEPNVTSYGPEHAVRLSFRAALDHINGCKECSGRGPTATLLRTFSPAHFENGTWDTGGACTRTGPYREAEIDLGGSEWGFRNVQMEEIERARGIGRERGKRFGALDVTRVMLMRPDGHPGEHWGNKWMRGYNDCVHWCLPGPIDVWNDFLMAALRLEGGMNS
ncbi:hypothetical protein BT93_J1933 [Corymbia citriodora subsp. variegata]|nr:hypothetical protein BT93_J1933 [Corymbia citriodora subsp. variegata]